MSDTEREKPLILVVDDEPANLRPVVLLLRANDYDVITAGGGGEALDWLKDNSPDLILLDVMMPGMDGYEVCRKIKKDLRTAGIPVIFLTAKAESRDVVAGFEAGGVDYVHKPFHGEELLARVRAHVDLHRLKAMLPICSYCKRIRDDSDFWHQVDAYISRHTGTLFSHGICPDCYEKLEQSDGF